jgi:DNA mismatch repair protein MutS2
MPHAFAPGDAVQTPFGKGVVSEVRNGGQLLVQIQERTLVVNASHASPLASSARRPVPVSAAPPPPVSRGRERHAPSEVDLHGLTVEEALPRIDDALDAALLAGLPELRFIHGRSGGKLRGALHQRLRAIAAVRGLRLDPRNPGVTIVTL